ncbi:MAG: radical SAM protein [Patescibacteria group bacterium]|jgi:biotin synthase
MNAVLCKIRISIGSAAVLGLTKLKQQALPRTIYLMNSGGCQYNCSFCTQAKQATARADKLARVSWPEFTTAAILQALKQKHTKYRRICLQVVNTPNILPVLPDFIKQIKLANPAVKLAVNIRTLDIKVIDNLITAGADEIGLSIDAIDAQIFKKIRHGQLDSLLKFIIILAKKYPNKIATHLIVGLGESEKDMVQIIKQLSKYKVIIALFAFTPVVGAQLPTQPSPNLSSYRRIQTALYLIRNNYPVKCSYNSKKQIISFGVTKSKLKKILEQSNAFETSGCTDCNRPYYNDRAGQKQLYNYPDKIKTSALANIVQSIFNYN